MPPYRGGIARFSASLAEKLLEMGHDVKVISFRKRYPKMLYPGKTEKYHSQTISEVNTSFLKPTILNNIDTSYLIPIYVECQTTALTLLSSVSDEYQNAFDINDILNQLGTRLVYHQNGVQIVKICE
jgi:hypothetical protein